MELTGSFHNEHPCGNTWNLSVKSGNKHTMKKILTALILSLVTLNADARFYERICDPVFTDYWQRRAYDQGFKDGYECGFNYNDYRKELDRIAYEIGFIDGCDMFDRVHRIIRTK
jgi:hypothetical protein